MYHDYFSNFARRNCAFFSEAVPVHRVVRAVEFKMATGCKFLSLAASLAKPFSHFGIALKFSNFDRNSVGNPTFHDKNRQIPATLKWGTGQGTLIGNGEQRSRGTGEPGDRGTRELRNRETLHLAILPLL